METLEAGAKPVKLTDRERRQEAHSKMLEVLRPYHPRCTAEWTDKQKNAVYLFVLFSKDREAYWNAMAQSYERHKVRGCVVVNILHDGSTFFFYGEDFALKQAGIERTGKWDDSTAVLEQLIKPLPPIE